MKTHPQDKAASTPQTASPSGKRRWGWYVVVIVVLSACAWLALKVMAAGLVGFTPLEMAAAQYTPKDVVGDLGGMKVTIPRHIAEYVEYDGDPGWGEKRKGPRPERTHDSRLKSFGFKVRDHDLATLSSPQMWADYEKYSKPEWTVRHGSRGGDTWVDVGITSGQSYPGDGFLDRGYKATLVDPPYGKWDAYAKQAKAVEGLEHYVVKGVDPETGEPSRELDPTYDIDKPEAILIRGNTKMIYVARYPDGKVMTEVRCHYTGIQPCTQTWSLEREGVHALVYVQYLRERLHEWQHIQKQVTRLILSFRVADSAPAQPSSSAVAQP
jgi:hypothetical protein